MTILVLGASGQLAMHLQGLLPDATFWGRDRFDLRNPSGLSAVIQEARPELIVNAAAYTAVDKAEVEREAAWSLNAEAPAMAARAAAELDIPMIHVSTDYVFDGNKQGEYSVGDTCNPVSVYGTTKLAGELAVRLLAPKCWILRTSWVFSEHGSTFVKTILRLARERQELRVVADQFGRPTYAGDLARLIARIALGPVTAVSLPFGTYHAVGGAVTSWHGFAQAIVQAALRAGLLSREPLVRAIPTSEYPTAARRPQNSSLEPSLELFSATEVTFDWVKGLDAAVQGNPGR